MEVLGHPPGIVVATNAPVFSSRVKCAAIIIGLAVCWQFRPWRPIEHAPGIIAPGEPVQVAIEKISLGEVEGYAVQAVACYELTARVLRTKRYHSGPGSNLVPVDVAVAWGPMSDQTVLDQLKISQGNRFYFYRWQNRPPLPLKEIITHSANIHVISANDEVARVVRGLRAGEVVRMRGYLVNVTGPRGFSWNSSLTRHDSGKGACEVYYVEHAEPVSSRS